MPRNVFFPCQKPLAPWTCLNRYPRYNIKFLVIKLLGHYRGANVFYSIMPVPYYWDTPPLLTAPMDCATFFLTCCMKPKPYLIISACLFVVVSVLHLFRLVLGWSLSMEGAPIPMWFSWIGFAVPLALAVWAYCLTKNEG
jgi:hypothetical protein